MKRLMMVVAVALTAFAANCETAEEGKPEAEKSVIVQKVRSPLGKEIDALAEKVYLNEKTNYEYILSCAKKEQFILSVLNKLVADLQMCHTSLTNLEARLVVFENEKKEREARIEENRAKREKEREREAARKRDAVKTVSDIIKRGKAFERKQNGGK